MALRAVKDPRYFEIYLRSISGHLEPVQSVASCERIVPAALAAYPLRRLDMGVAQKRTDLTLIGE